MKEKKKTEYIYSKNRATQSLNAMKANSPYILSNHLLCAVGEIKVDEISKQRHFFKPLSLSRSIYLSVYVTMIVLRAVTGETEGSYSDGFKG